MFIDHNVWCDSTFSFLNKKASKVIVSKIKEIHDYMLFDRNYSFNSFLTILKEILKCTNLDEFDLVELYTQIKKRIEMPSLRLEKEFIELIKKHPHFKGFDTAEIVFNSMK